MPEVVIPQASQSDPGKPSAGGTSQWIGGRYRIERALAKGGMGAVYAVHDERTGQRVALKRMRGADAKALLGLFEREYRTLAGLHHPRIVEVYDYGVDAGEPYYTMELIEGRDLYELSPIPFVQACRYLRDVATCLALLHTRRLLHRDVTPRNVRVRPDGSCLLLDFGALTAFGVPERTVGTPPCIPPEALRGAPLDQRADLFAFGALAYWTLTRRHAYPARTLDELPESWQHRPSPPSKYAPDVPPGADALILSLLELDPQKRPGTIAEVVARLELLAGLPPEDEATQQALAESYLAHVQFIGRERELDALRAVITRLQNGEGSSVIVTGPSGVGRTRLLSELLLQSRLLGVTSVLVDATTSRQSQGTATALLLRLIDVSPAARLEAEAHAAVLAQLSPSLADRLDVTAVAPDGKVSGDWRARIHEIMHRIVSAACRTDRVLIAIDNAEEADEGSLALLAALQRLTSTNALALVCSIADESEVVEATASMSLPMLMARSSRVVLAPLSAHETLSLARSLFADAPGLGRFAEWLYQRTAGRPLHLIELVHRLRAKGLVRYADGLWQLPVDRLDALIPEGLEDLLVHRLDELSPAALGLAESMALQLGALSRERCQTLARFESEQPSELLDALLRGGVLSETLEGYRFSHGVLREVLLKRLSAEQHKKLHVRCAELELHSTHDAQRLNARIAAGWHLLQAGEESRGADLLAEVTYDSAGVRFAFDDLKVAAPAISAALTIYTKQGRSLYERMPLLAALAQASYYEDRMWGLRYGDEALAACEQVSGVALARKLQPWLGKTLGLIAGLVTAFVRFTVTPKKVARYRFMDVLVQLFGTVTTLTGSNAIALDPERAEAIAARLSPFAHLPERLTPVGIWQFCSALGELAREHQSSALATWNKLLERFYDPRWYPTLPERVRPLYTGGLHFASGVFEAFRDAGGALKHADALDRLGLKLYRMVASELRYLHYALRGEMQQAQRHREQVELHAIQMGSAWQVELWEPACQILVFATLGDVVGMQRATDRLKQLAQTTPSLALYAELAQHAVHHAHIDRAGKLGSDGEHEALANRVLRDLQLMADSRPARSFIGWGATCGFQASALNLVGRHAECKALCERVLEQVNDTDLEFVILFLTVQLQHAVALASLGDVDGARRELDALLARHAKSDNPLTRGRLHEAYARVEARAERWESFRHHLEETRSWYRSTGTPVLVARAESLTQLEPRTSTPPLQSDRAMAVVTSPHRPRRNTASRAPSTIDTQDDDMPTAVLPVTASAAATIQGRRAQSMPPDEDDGAVEADDPQR